MIKMETGMENIDVMEEKLLWQFKNGGRYKLYVDVKNGYIWESVWLCVRIRTNDCANNIGDRGMGIWSIGECTLMIKWDMSDRWGV